MPILHLLHTRTFDEEMDRLRIACFPEEGWSRSARDVYDDVSIHVVCRVEKATVGYGRLTPGEHNYFRTKFGPNAPLPDGLVSFDFGRIVVAPAHRGHLLFELILLDGLLLATDLGISYVVGSSRPERRFRPLIQELGFTDHGEPVNVTNNPQVCLLQPVVAQTSGIRDGWYARKQVTLQRLREKGHEIVDDGCGPSRPAGSP